MDKLLISRQSVGPKRLRDYARLAVNTLKRYITTIYCLSSSLSETRIQSNLRI